MKNKINKKSTIREILQFLGTELLREQLNYNIHVAALIGSIEEIDNTIITDMRFPNEMEAVKKRGGITIRVNRNSVYKDSDTQFSHDIPHPSETALDNATFDYVIDNNGSIEELIEKVKGILIKENLI